MPNSTTRQNRHTTHRAAISVRQRRRVSGVRRRQNIRKRGIREDIFTLYVGAKVLALKKNKSDNFKEPKVDYDGWASDVADKSDAGASCAGKVQLLQLSSMSDSIRNKEEKRSRRRHTVLTANAINIVPPQGYRSTKRLRLSRSSWNKSQAQARLAGRSFHIAKIVSGGMTLSSAHEDNRHGKSSPRRQRQNHPAKYLVNAARNAPRQLRISHYRRNFVQLNIVERRSSRAGSKSTPSARTNVPLSPVCPSTSSSHLLKKYSSLASASQSPVRTSTQQSKNSPVNAQLPSQLTNLAMAVRATNLKKRITRRARDETVCAGKSVEAVVKSSASEDAKTALSPTVNTVKVVGSIAMLRPKSAASSLYNATLEHAPHELQDMKKTAGTTTKAATQTGKGAVMTGKATYRAGRGAVKSVHTAMRLIRTLGARQAVKALIIKGASAVLMLIVKAVVAIVKLVISFIVPILIVVAVASVIAFFVSLFAAFPNAEEERLITYAEFVHQLDAEVNRRIQDEVDAHDDVRYVHDDVTRIRTNVPMFFAFIATIHGQDWDGKEDAMSELHEKTYSLSFDYEMFFDEPDENTTPPAPGEPPPEPIERTCVIVDFVVYNFYQLCEILGFDESQIATVRAIMELPLYAMFPNLGRFVNFEGMAGMSQREIDEIIRSLPPVSGSRADIVEIAMSFLLPSQNVVYRFGARGYGTDLVNRPTAFDCSGFTSWVYRMAGVHDSLGSTVGHWNQSVPISSDDLLPGDIGLLRRPEEANQAAGIFNHVGIFIGRDSQGRKMWIHCTSWPSPGGVVMDNTGGGLIHFRRVLVNFGD